jgi:hypothetical protein
MIAIKSTQNIPKQNQILAALPADIFERISPHLELISLQRGAVLYEAGSQLQNVYFPTNAILSLQYVMENGASAEIAGIGKEGVLGVSLFMGGSNMPSRAAHE